jgi:hypothetical protein
VSMVEQAVPCAPRRLDRLVHGAKADNTVTRHPLIVLVIPSDKENTHLIEFMSSSMHLPLSTSPRIEVYCAHHHSITTFIDQGRYDHDTNRLMIGV